MKEQPTIWDSRESTTTSILQLAEIGMSPQTTKFVMDFANESDISDVQKSYLFGPIVQHPSSWKDSTPQWMFDAIFPERAAIITKELESDTEDWRIGSVELATALYPATMAARPSHETTQIYLWSAAQATAKHRGVPTAEILEELALPESLGDAVQQKGGAYFDEYKRLCSAIRETVVEQYKKQRAKERLQKMQYARAKQRERGDDMER